MKNNTWDCEEIQNADLIAIDLLFFLLDWDAKLVDPDPTSLILRSDLLKSLDITSQALSYRIRNMGFPNPVKSEGRKQWFSNDEVDRWRKQNR